MSRDELHRWLVATRYRRGACVFDKHSPGHLALCCRSSSRMRTRAVTAIIRALHLRSGQTLVERRVDAWLERPGVDALTLSDVFATCALLARGLAISPQLVLVGLDGLTADQRCIVDYARRALPEATVIEYASDIARAPGSLSGASVWFSHRLEAALNRDPSEWIEPQAPVQGG